MKKILTCFSIALDIFSIIISRFIPCSIIVRMGSRLKKKIQVLLISEETLGFWVLSCIPSTELGGKCVKPGLKLQGTCVARKISAELIWKLSQGKIFS